MQVATCFLGVERCTGVTVIRGDLPPPLFYFDNLWFLEYQAMKNKPAKAGTNYTANTWEVLRNCRWRTWSTPSPWHSELFLSCFWNSMGPICYFRNFTGQRCSKAHERFQFFFWSLSFLGCRVLPPSPPFSFLFVSLRSLSLGPFPWSGEGGGAISNKLPILTFVRYNDLRAFGG